MGSGYFMNGRKCWRSENIINFFLEICWNFKLSSLDNIFSFKFSLIHCFFWQVGGGIRTFLGQKPIIIIVELSYVSERDQPILTCTTTRGRPTQLKKHRLKHIFNLAYFPLVLKQFKISSIYIKKFCLRVRESIMIVFKVETNWKKGGFHVP